MGENSGIEWCDHTWNPWIGCTRVSEGCRNCYAEGVGKRLGVRWGSHARRRAAPSTLRLPFRWDRRAAREGRRYRVFCSSLADVFDPDVPDAWRDQAFAVMSLTPNLDWLVLTKRPERMWEYFGHPAHRVRICCQAELLRHPAWHPEPSPASDDWPLPNVWLGVSAEDQATADQRIPILLDTPAALRFVSCEPLLGPVDLECTTGGTRWIGGQRGCGGTHRHGGTIDPHRHGPGTSLCFGDPRRPHHHHDDRCRPGLDWVIVGGESGPGARPMHPDWARDLRDQCAAAGVAFMFKQWGEWAPGENCDHVPTKSEHVAYWFNNRWDFDCLTPQAAEALHRDDEPDLYRVGKARAGRLLDGRTHDEVPS